MEPRSELNVLAIAGSLRNASYNRALLRAVATFEIVGITIELEDGLGLIPPFNEDDEGERTPAAVSAFRQRIGKTDALLIATPEYNHSIPGVLKNAVDWASRPFGLAEIVGKPVGLISSSGSPFGGVWAQADLRRVLTASGARVLEAGVAVSKVGERFDTDGTLADGETQDQLRQIVVQLAELVRTPIEDDL